MTEAAVPKKLPSHSGLENTAATSAPIFCVPSSGLSSSLSIRCTTLSLQTGEPSTTSTRVSATVRRTLGSRCTSKSLSTFTTILRPLPAATIASLAAATTSSASSSSNDASARGARRLLLRGGLDKARRAAMPWSRTSVSLPSLPSSSATCKAARHFGGAARGSTVASMILTSSSASCAQPRSIFTARTRPPLASAIVATA
mmetsp:Transcript_83247/g.217402  ORF Transcript_83247/g.217402 Transcript_83247/m.217402 type:complete len:201 (-) Transcript_83247:169-771(-)